MTENEYAVLWIAVVACKNRRARVDAHAYAVARWGFYKARRIGQQNYPKVVCSPQIDSRPHRRGCRANAQGTFPRSRSLTAEPSIDTQNMRS
jgi:hypothetical protein